MAKKKTAIDRTIEQIQGEIEMRQKMIDMLRTQQAAAPKRKVRAKAAEAAEAPARA